MKSSKIQKANNCCQNTEITPIPSMGLKKVGNSKQKICSEEKTQRSRVGNESAKTPPEEYKMNDKNQKITYLQEKITTLQIKLDLLRNHESMEKAEKKVK